MRVIDDQSITRLALVCGRSPTVCAPVCACVRLCARLCVCERAYAIAHAPERGTLAVLGGVLEGKMGRLGWGSNP